MENNRVEIYVRETILGAIFVFFRIIIRNSKDVEIYIPIERQYTRKLLTGKRIMKLIGKMPTTSKVNISWYEIKYEPPLMDTITISVRDFCKILRKLLMSKRSAGDLIFLQGLLERYEGID